MSLKTILDLYELMDDSRVTGNEVINYVRRAGVHNCTLKQVKGAKGSADFIEFTLVGKNGRTVGGTAPTLGIIGRLGGIGARPERIGFTSDGDGALCAASIAAKLGMMQLRGDKLEGDVIVTTQICPDAPTRPHEPVPFMDSPVSSAQSNAFEVNDRMDAVLCIDTTKGNRIINHQGFALSPTVKSGYILRTSEDLLSIMQTTTGALPVVFALTQQDITPYGNGIYHLNSILQPSVATDKPCVGVAITTQTQVAGCATGATHVTVLDDVVRFCIEVAKDFTAGHCHFYDPQEFTRLNELYGTLTHFQTMGKGN